jgi:hypothetical protein
MSVRRATSDELARCYAIACLEIIDPFPGWDPGNPCAIYVKALI